MESLELKEKLNNLNKLNEIILDILTSFFNLMPNKNLSLSINTHKAFLVALIFY